MNASHISRTLRSHGLNPLGSGTPRTRQGVRVTQGLGHVSICCDFDSESTAARRSDTVSEVLNDSGIAHRRVSYTLIWVED